MRVLLIPPAHAYRYYPTPLSASDFPAGFGYIAAALKKAGHQVFGCNPNNKFGYKSAKAMIAGEIISAIQEHKPDLIGLGGLCTDYPFLKDAIGVIRQVCDTPLVLGGNIVTNDADFIFNDLKPDYAVVGEGEEAIVSIANGTFKPGIIKYPVKQYASLDDRPFPDYEPFGLKDMVDNWSMATRVLYRYSRLHPRPYNIVASRSCPFSCTFCIHGHREIPYRARSIKNIMAEIKESYERYQFNIVILLDELFAVSDGRLRDFSLAVIDGRKRFGWDFDWCFQTHASARLSLDTLKLAKEAGCYFFSYGIESASPTVLKSMGKHSKSEQVIEAIRLAKEAKLGFGGNLIFGDPAETLDTMRESLYFWLQKCRDEMVFLGFVMPYPGSKLFSDCLARGLIPDKKAYYETIDQKHINMTQIPTPVVAQWHGFINFLERSWLNVEVTTMTRYETEVDNSAYAKLVGGKGHIIYAACPHCGGEIASYQIFAGIPKGDRLGIGCNHCGRKVRVNL